MSQATDESRGTRTLVRKAAGWLAATLTLLVTGVLVYRYLFQYGVTNIWGGDGAVQHFPAFHYCRDVVISALRDPVHAFTMWSPNIGLGADTMGTLSYYLGDPFALVSLAFPARSLEYVYEAMFFVRLLVAGLGAFGYLRAMRAKTIGAIAGSVVYVFTTYTMFSALRHPYFANPLVWFPLILLGVEHALRKKRPYLLVVAVLLAGVSSYYFLYQMTLVVVVYAVCRYFELAPKGRRLIGLVPSAVWVAALYLLGAACAAFLLWPSLDAFFTSSRVGSTMPMKLFYDVDTYRSYVAAFTSSESGTNSAFLGFSALCALVMPIIFMRRRRNTTLKIMLVLLPLTLVSPWIGTAFNGFAFPSYRFLFMWGLFLGAAVADVLSEDRTLSGAETVVSLVWWFVYSAAVVIAFGSHGIKVVLPLGLGALMWFLFAVERFGPRVRKSSDEPTATSATDLDAPPRTAHAPSTFLRIAILGLVVVNVAVLGVFAFDHGFSDRLNEYVPSGQTLAAYLTGSGTIARDLPGASSSRVDRQESAFGSLDALFTTPGSDLKIDSTNDALVQDYHGISSYYSVIDGGVHAYFNGLDVRTQRDSFEYNGVDDRAALEALNGVRYYVPNEVGARYVPYGFDQRSQPSTQPVYENRNALPIGFVYHSVVASATYAALGPLDKQQALLQGVVLGDDAQVSNLPSIVPTSEVIDVPYSTTTTGTTTFDAAAGRFLTVEGYSKVMLHFAPVPDAELYVDMTGISFDLATPTTESLAAALSESLITELSEKPDPDELNDVSPLIVAMGTTGPSKLERQESPLDDHYWGDTSVLTNLGYFPLGRSNAYVRLVEAADVHFTGLHVYAVPMAHFAEHVSALAADGMTGVTIGENTVSGSVSSHGDGLLFLSIPYSRGWTATVDGKPARVVRANVGFCGIPVTGGSHAVVLRYVTPVLPMALRVSAVGFVALTLLVVGWEIVAFVRWMRRDRQEPAAEADAPPVGERSAATDGAAGPVAPLAAEPSGETTAPPGPGTTHR